APRCPSQEEALVAAKVRARKVEEGQWYAVDGWRAVAACDRSCVEVPVAHVVRDVAKDGNVEEARGDIHPLLIDKDARGRVDVAHCVQRGCEPCEEREPCRAAPHAQESKVPGARSQ